MPSSARRTSNAVRNFVLGGAELQGDAKKRFADIQERQAELSQKFSENALDATDAFAYYAKLGELDGVPEDVVSAARAAAEAEGKDGYKLTLKMPCYLPVMQFAKSSALRETLYRAYVTRASEFGDAAFDNTALITRDPRAARRRSAAPGLQEFRRGLGGAEDGRIARAGVKFLRDLAPRPSPMENATWPTCAPSPPNN
jgi:oligopeptidase A